MLAREGVAVAPHADDVEARDALFEPMAVDVVLCRARNLALLAQVDHVERAHQRASLACLNLDKDQRSTIESDQIDLAEAAPIVSREDHETLPPQKLFRRLLAARTKKLTSMRHGVTLNGCGPYVNCAAWR